MAGINRIGHVVLYVRNPAASAEWYCKTLGMEVVLENKRLSYAFLSFGQSDHDIALFKAPDDRRLGQQDLQHIGLEFSGDLEEYKQLHDKLVTSEVEIVGVLDHGTAYGIYFRDPDGHILEIFYQRIANDGTSKRKLGEIGALADPIDLARVTS